MPRVLIEPAEPKRLIRERRRCGGDRVDEVWNGVYVMSPLADIEHQFLTTKLAGAFDQAMRGRDEVIILAGTNVSDRRERWKQNDRCPDVAVFLPGNPAENRGDYWLGGPEFAVEILSPYDRSRKKLEFYASVGVRELLLVDRKPWRLELYRLAAGKLEGVGQSDPDSSADLESEVLPMRFRLVAAQDRAQIVVTTTDATRTWTI